MIITLMYDNPLMHSCESHLMSYICLVHIHMAFHYQGYDETGFNTLMP